MNWIENILNNNNVQDLDSNKVEKLQTKIIDVAESYNKYVYTFDKIKDNKDINYPPMKYFGFLMRDWLNKYLNLTYPEEGINIPVGDKTDSPIEISKDIFDINAPFIKLVIQKNDNLIELIRQWPSI